MAKKFSLLMAAVAVLAVAIPAMASAGSVTSKAGTFAPVGTVLTGVSTNAVTTTTIGNLTCKEVKVTGKITKNSEAEGVAGTGTGEGTSSTCFIGGSTPITVEDITLTSIQSLKGETPNGKAGFVFKAKLPGLTCTYTASAAPFSYVTNSDKITFTKAPLTASPSACGSATLDADFTLTIGSTPIIIM